MVSNDRRPGDGWHRAPEGLDPGGAVRLMVGRYYARADGAVVHITGHPKGYPCWFVGADGNWYTSRGLFLASYVLDGPYYVGESQRRNLVREAHPEAGLSLIAMIGEEHHGERYYAGAELAALAADPAPWPEGAAWLGKVANTAETIAQRLAGDAERVPPCECDAACGPAAQLALRYEAMRADGFYVSVLDPGYITVEDLGAADAGRRVMFTDIAEAEQWAKLRRSNVCAKCGERLPCEACRVADLRAVCLWCGSSGGMRYESATGAAVGVCDGCIQTAIEAKF